MKLYSVDFKYLDRYVSSDIVLAKNKAEAIAKSVPVYSYDDSEKDFTSVHLEELCEKSDIIE